MKIVFFFLFSIREFVYLAYDIIFNFIRGLVESNKNNELLFLCSKCRIYGICVKETQTLPFRISITIRFFFLKAELSEQTDNNTNLFVG